MMPATFKNIIFLKCTQVALFYLKYYNSFYNEKKKKKAPSGLSLKVLQ